MKPSIGRIVIVKGIQSNCANEHPAIITRVWSEGPDGSHTVNLTVFPDCCGVVHAVTSIYLFPDRTVAEAYQDRNAGEHAKPIVAFWPERA